MSQIPRSEHPRPDRKRAEWLCLNGEWDFEIDNQKVGIEQKYYLRQTLDGKITVPFSPESVLSGVGHTDFMQAVWYRRNMEIPKNWAGKRVILHIDAADHTTTVFVNGKQVGQPHKGGYTSFAYDITHALKSEGNYLTVYAEDDQLSGKQFAGKQSDKKESYGCLYTRTTGIWQTVWLEAVPKAYIDSYRVYPNISAPSVTLAVKTVGAKAGDLLRVEAFYQGMPMGDVQTVLSGDTAHLTVDLNERHLWECGKGRLYDLSFTLLSQSFTSLSPKYPSIMSVQLWERRVKERS